MTTAIFAFPENARQAQALADRCGIPMERIEVRSFPDGESLVRAHGKASTALLFRSLDDPNAKLVETLLAAAALRDVGAGRVILVAPYLAYMRQDKAFHEGEAVSQRVIGTLLARWFDGVLTVDPHLHRVHDLAEVVTGIPAVAVSAAPALVEAIAGEIDPATVLVGPDSESRPWVESIARPLGLEVLVGEKRRRADRDVSIKVPGIARVRGRPALLVDDVISSGGTLISCAKVLREAGATRIDAIASHALASDADLDRLAEAGIVRVSASDSTANRVATISLGAVLAEALRGAGWVAPWGAAGASG